MGSPMGQVGCRTFISGVLAVTVVLLVACCVGAAGAGGTTATTACMAMAGRWSTSVGTCLPDGKGKVLHHEGFVKDPDAGWINGHHPDMEPHQQGLRDLMARHKGCFAYSAADLPGYSGEQGPFSIKLKHENDIFVPQRRFSALEQKVQNEKCGEMRDSGIIVRTPHTATRYAARATMPAKMSAKSARGT